MVENEPDALRHRSKHGYSGSTVTDDKIQRAYERLAEANARLDAVWPAREQKPKEARAAIDELNEAGKALNRLFASSAASGS